MIMIGQKCTCPCHKTGAMHFMACCFKCPCCGKQIGYANDDGRIYGHEKREELIKQHLACCTEANPEPIKDQQLSSFERYMRQMGFSREEIFGKNIGKENREEFIKSKVGQNIK